MTIKKCITIICLAFLLGGCSCKHTIVIDEKIDPTCELPGMTEGQHCGDCGEVLVEQEVIEPLGHDTVIDEAVAPSCLKEGLTEGSHCSRCGKVFIKQETVPALGHNFQINDEDCRCLNCNLVVPVYHVLNDVCLACRNDSYMNVLNYGVGTAEQSKPNKVTIEWPLNDNVDYLVELLCDKKQITKNIFGNSISFSNLFVDTFYTVNVYSADELVYTTYFKTANDLVRTIDVDGVVNFRDIGGKTNVDGKKIRQGMIYRSGAFNVSNTSIPTLLATEAGVNTLLNDLEIKTEIDLRKQGTHENGGLTDSSLLGDSVKYYHFPISNGLDDNALLRQIFHLFSDISNYPIDFHCVIGTDRTGFVGCILDCLLNLSKDDIYFDYLFSNLSDIKGSRAPTRKIPYVDLLNAPGNSIQEKTINHLLSVGVTIDEIESILQILIEK